MRILKPHADDGKKLLGIHLLALCEQLAGQALAEQPEGTGQRDDPFRPIKLTHWVWCWRNSRGSFYYRIGNRLIFKDQRHYVSDVIVTDAPNSHEHAIKDPTYRAIRDVFEGVENQNLQDSFSSPGVSSKIQDILRGKYQYDANGSGDANIMRLAHHLPVFSAAMLIAEPARNKRAWPINMMIVDLVRNSVWTYPWSEIVWHPLDGRTLSQLPFFEVHDTGPLQDYGAGKKPQRVMGTVEFAADLHLIGGKMPASPTKGGEIGKAPLFTRSGPPGREKEAFNLSMKYDYIHQKELDVLMDWLATNSSVKSYWREGDRAANDAYSKSDTISLGYMKSSDVMSAADPGVAAIKAELIALMTRS